MESTQFQFKQVPLSGKRGLILNDIQLHGLSQPNTGKWYEKLMFLFRKRRPGRIYTNTQRMFIENGRIGFELGFPVSKQMLTDRKGAAQDISELRKFTRPEGIKLFMAKDLADKIKKANRQAGVARMEDHFEARAELAAGTIDTATGTANIKVFLK